MGPEIWQVNTNTNHWFQTFYWSFSMVHRIQIENCCFSSMPQKGLLFLWLQHEFSLTLCADLKIKYLFSSIHVIRSNLSVQWIWSWLVKRKVGYLCYLPIHVIHSNLLVQWIWSWLVKCKGSYLWYLPFQKNPPPWTCFTSQPPGSARFTFLKQNVCSF